MFKQMSVIALAILFLFCTASLSFAEYKKIKAIGTIETKFIKTATTGQKKEAIENAKKNAMDKYIAGLDSQRIRMLNNFKDELYKNINLYVPEVVPLNDGKWENGYWSIDVEASINEAQIEELINKYAQSNSKKNAEENLSFVFVAREVESVKEFMGEKAEKTAEGGVYKENLGVSEQANVKSSEKLAATTNEKVGENAKKKLGIAGSAEQGVVSKASTEEVKYQGEATSKYQGSETSKYHGNMSDETKNVYEKTTSGSIEKKSEVVKYRSYSPEEVEAKVTEVFNKADIQVVPTFEVGIDTGKFIKDFSIGNDITDATKKETVDLAKSKGLNLIAVGMLDVGREQVDQATGLSKIYVVVTGYILDLNGKFTKKIASIGPVQYSGIGENPKVAKVNALNNAASAAAKDLVDQFREKRSL